MRDDEKLVKWSVSPNVRATYSEDGAVLLDIQGGTVYSLNVVGARMWQMIEADLGSSTTDDVVEALSPQFRVSKEQLKADTENYLQHLLDKGLIHANGADHPAKKH